MDGLIQEKFSELYKIIIDFKRFLFIEEIVSLSAQEVEEILDRCYNLEVLIKDLNERGLKKDFDLWCVSMNYAVRLEEVQNAGDLALGKFMSQKVKEDVAFQAIKGYLKLFGEPRFERVCSVFGSVRQCFLSVSSLVNVRFSVEDVQTSLLLEHWDNLLLLGCESEVIVSIKDTFLSENAVLSLFRLASLKNHSTRDNLINLIYCQALQMLSPCNIKIWNSFLRHKPFFQDLIQKYPTQTVPLIFENMVDSAKCHRFLDDKWVCDLPDSKLSIPSVLQIVSILFRTEITYNKMKKFLSVEKSNSQSKFWSMIEKKYFET